MIGCGHRNGHSKPAAVKAPGQARNGSHTSTGSPFIDALDVELGRVRRFVGARSEELWGRLLAVIEVPLSKTDIRSSEQARERERDDLHAENVMLPANQASSDAQIMC